MKLNGFLLLGDPGTNLVPDFGEEMRGLAGRDAAGEAFGVEIEEGEGLGEEAPCDFEVFLTLRDLEGIFLLGDPGTEPDFGTFGDIVIMYCDAM